jgi:hypothetical protein
MSLQLKLIGYTCVAVVLGWVSWSAYGYFFFENPPCINVIGMESDKYYAGDVSLSLTGSDDYKVSHVSVFLDDKLLAPKHIINKQSFERNIQIPTKTLNDGKHEITFVAQNSTYHETVCTKSISFNVDNTPLQAAFVKNNAEPKVWQGRTLHVQFQTNKPLKSVQAHAISKVYECYQEAPHSLVYECFIPIDCEESPNEYLLSIDLVDHVGNSLVLKNKFQVVRFPFKKQRIKIASDKIKKENNAGLSEKALEQELETLSEQSPCEKLWQGTFVKPTEIKQITTEFGVMRTTQERGLRQHKALDIYNNPKAVIWSTQDGVVVLKNRYAHSGNTVVVDHGCGLLSLFFHLDEFADIEVGDSIKKGHPVGTLGKTGYATGYHLHWEMRLNNIAIDPLEWTKHDF